MAIPVSALRALHLAARLYRVDFRKTAMLGRQEIKFTDGDLAAIIRKPLALDGDIATERYGEGLFKLLGAEVVDSIDASDYEGASIVMDFNTPLRREHHDAYSFYCDFGSMEHIFNVAQVVSNAADLLADDGHLLIFTNCNGFPTHGLYQFTPEFFYSTFSPRNGFQRTAVFLVELDSGYGGDDRWFYVRNPAVTGARNKMSGIGTCAIVCVSQKGGRPSSFQVQQSDYEHGAWQARRHRRQYPLQPLIRRIRQVARRTRDILGPNGRDLIKMDIETVSHDDFWRLVGGHPPTPS